MKHIIVHDFEEFVKSGVSIIGGIVAIIIVSFVFENVVLPVFEVVNALLRNIIVLVGLCVGETLIIRKIFNHGCVIPYIVNFIYAAEVFIIARLTTGMY